MTLQQKNTFLPSKYIRDRLPPAMANQFIHLLEKHGGFPRSARRKTKTEISRTTQRHGIQRMTYLLGQLPQVPEVVLANLNCDHAMIFADACVSRAGDNPGTLDNWVSSANRLLAMAGGRGALIISASALRKSLALGHRSRACEVDKSEAARAAGSQAIKAVREIDERAAGVLLLMQALPLRIAEAASLNLAAAVLQAKENHRFQVRAGAKNGLARECPIWNVNRPQLEVLESLAPLANKQYGSLIPEGKTRDQFLAYCYRIFAKAGLTKKGIYGFTTHAFRHAGLQDFFQHVTGEPAPIRAQSGRHSRDPVLVSGYKAVALAAGHFDQTKSSAYLGSIRLARPKKHTHPLNPQPQGAINHDNF
jgi:hypothetical protein